MLHGITTSRKQERWKLPPIRARKSHEIDAFPRLCFKSLCYMPLLLAVNRSGGYYSRFRVSDIVINTGVLRDRAAGRKQDSARRLSGEVRHREPGIPAACSTR